MKKRKILLTIYCFMNKNYKYIYLLFAIIQVFLISNITVYQRGYSKHDDILMIDYAEKLSEGEWLGLYDNTTLLKRISYPIFLTISHLSNIDYTTMLGLFWTGSVLLLAYSFRKIISNKIILFIMYIYVLFSPVMISFRYGQSMYRHAIIPGAVVLCIATLVGLFYDRKNKSAFFWSFSAGISFSFFWNIREDTIWLLPFFCGALFITSIYLFFENNKKISKRTVFILITPLIIFFSVNFTIKMVNLSNYGKYTSTELFESNYTNLVNLLSSIDEDPDLRKEKGIIVSKKTLNKLYDISPTLSSISEYIESDMYQSFWQTIGDNKNDGEMFSGYFFWALRDAVQSAGYYNSAKESNEFYGKIYNEIYTAIENGEIKKGDSTGFSLFGTQLFGDNSNEIFSAMINNCIKMVEYKDFIYETKESIGNVNNLRRTEALTGNILIYPSKYNIKISGWIFPNNENDILEVYLSDVNNQIITKLEQFESLDVYEYTIGENIENSQARNSRFEFSEEDSEVKNICIYINGSPIKTYNLEKMDLELFEEEQFHMYIENNIVDKIEDPNSNKQVINDKIYNTIILVYQKTSMIFTVISVIAFICLIVINVNNKIRNEQTYFSSIIILLGIVCSYLILMYGVATKYFDSNIAYKGVNYLAAVVPLQTIFISLTIGLFFHNYCSIYKRVS